MNKISLSATLVAELRNNSVCCVEKELQMKDIHFRTFMRCCEILTLEVISKTEACNYLHDYIGWDKS